MSKKPRKISLRTLAYELDVTHSSLSAAAHQRRLTDGVRVDARGRIVVTDADAAAAQWRSIHVPQNDELCRRTDAPHPAPSQPRVIIGDRVFTAKNIAAEDLERNLREWGHPMFNALTRQDLIELVDVERLHEALLRKWARDEGIALKQEREP